MSTFRGVMKEFPDVRVDFFRRDPGLRPPLACFLSHVHSDHLVGLESFKSPFIYCSAATKEMLLKLERYPHQLNFELGIFESRKLQYKHLQNLLKPIPLETPTRIELSPGNEIQVTLFDANHCTGAVMFLFEGQNKAVLYTGDIRSEPWFVNNLTRNPFLMEYTTGMKTLECVYLDTSNLGPYGFPTKAEGLKELLEKVSKYPADTIFHFSAWTFGYEEVWMALSRFLKSQIHVSKYNMRLYRALGGPENNSGSALAPEALCLTGYTVGNTPHVGCLTTDNNVRLHSCRKGMNCPAINDNIVYIQPIITRTQTGGEIEEVGVGGGGGDLLQRPHLDLTNFDVLTKLIRLIPNEEGVARTDLRATILRAWTSLTKVLTLDDLEPENEGNETSITDLIKNISKSLTAKKSGSPAPPPAATLPTSADKEGLPKRITFPYSRHSSLAELQDLVGIFKPKDVYPCTVVKVGRWHEGLSMENLFGPHCSEKMFTHDKMMRNDQAKARALRMKVESNKLTHQQTQSTENSESSPYGPSTSTPASQSLRRKAVEDNADSEESSKRPRLNSSETDSPLPFQESRIVHPSGDSDSSTDTESEIPHGYESGSLYFGLEYDNYGTRNDTVDRVVRCGSCSHEFWGKYPGGCTNCDRLEDLDQVSDDEIEEYPYFEVQKPYTELNEEGLRPLPAYEINEDMRDPYGEETLISHEDICEPYLDCGSSAYDSQDEDPEFEEEYEIDSFINDDSSESEGEDEDSKDDEIDYEEKFNALQGRHLWLRNRYSTLLDEFEEMRRDLMGSEYESVEMSDSEEDEDEDLDEDEDGRILVVDVTPPDPLVAEVVVTDSGEDETSNDSLMEELRDAPLEFEFDFSGAVAEVVDVGAVVEVVDVDSSVQVQDGGFAGFDMVSEENNHSVMEEEL